MLWGGVLTALMAGSMVTLVRGFVSRFGLPLVIASAAVADVAIWLAVACPRAGCVLGPPGQWQHGPDVGDGYGDCHAGVLAAAGGRLRPLWPQSPRHIPSPEHEAHAGLGGDYRLALPFHDRGTVVLLRHL